MNKFHKTVLLTAMFVGTTDLISAFITVWVKTGKYAPGLLNYIAGGAIGLENSFKGGNGTALLGLFIHYFISYSFTLFFFMIFKHIKFLSFNKYFIGMLYAVFVNLVTEQGMLPLTPLPARVFVLSTTYISWVVLGVFFGIPIVYNTYRYYGVEDTGNI